MYHDYPQYSRSRQEGLALAVSLMLLVAMTIVGIATMKGTRLNEKISSNAQQKAISFEAAESSIATVWDVESLLDTLEQIPDNVFNDPDYVVPLVDAAELDFNQSNQKGVSVEVAASVTVQYCGETDLPTGSSLSADESKLQMAGIMFDVNGRANISGSKAESDHVQRGYVVRPKTGRTGNCSVPGT